MRTYENYVIIPQSYIIPSFQVRQGYPTTRFALRAIGASPKPQLERQKKNGNLPPKHQTNFTK